MTVRQLSELVAYLRTIPATPWPTRILVTSPITGLRI